MFDTIRFLLKFDHHLCSTKYKIDKTTNDDTKKISGKVADKNTLNIEVDGVNNVSFEF